jgi:hypothetical protein
MNVNTITIINKIEREKELSLQWVEKVRDIIEGKKINSQYLPIDLTSFSFDYLFFAKFDELSVNKLELKYKKIHSIYGRIFQNYFEVVAYPEEGELNYKCKNISEKEKVLAMEDLVFLEAVTKEFITYLTVLKENETQKNEAYSCFEIAS